MQGGRAAALSPCLKGRASEKAVAQLLQNVRRRWLGAAARRVSKGAAAGSAVAREVGGAHEKNGVCSFAVQCDGDFGAGGSQDASCGGLQGLGFQKTALGGQRSADASFRNRIVRHIEGISSRWGSQTFLQNFRSCIGSEVVLLVHKNPSLGSRAGPIRRATFDASAFGRPGLTDSSTSYISRETGNDDKVAAPNLEHSTGRPKPGSGEVAPRVNYAVRPSDGRPQTTPGVVAFRRTSSQSSNAGRGVQAPIGASADGSQKVAARIVNVPKFLFKNDVLWLLKGCDLRGCNLTLEDFVFIYDAKYRLKAVQLILPSAETFRLLQRSLPTKGRCGGRYLKLTTEGTGWDEINKGLAPFRGRSLLMVNIHLGVTTEDVERFFSGYAIDSRKPIKFLRSQIQSRVRNGQRAAGPVKHDVEILAAVRFKTDLEALRALREMQGAYCRENPIELRFIE